MVYTCVQYFQSCLTVTFPHCRLMCFIQFPPWLHLCLVLPVMFNCYIPSLQADVFIQFLHGYTCVQYFQSCLTVIFLTAGRCVHPVSYVVYTCVQCFPVMFNCLHSLTAGWCVHPVPPWLHLCPVFPVMFNCYIPSLQVDVFIQFLCGYTCVQCFLVMFKLFTFPHCRLMCSSSFLCGLHLCPVLPVMFNCYIPSLQADVFIQFLHGYTCVQYFQSCLTVIFLTAGRCVHPVPLWLHLCPLFPVMFNCYIPSLQADVFHPVSSMVTPVSSTSSHV